jgi:hypothetical protein
MSNITVRLNLGQQQYGGARTDENGLYTIRYLMPYLEYSVIFYSDWTTNFTTNVTLTPGNSTYLNCTLESLPLGGLSGTVVKEGSAPAHEVAVHLHFGSEPAQLRFTDVYGEYRFDKVPSGSVWIVFELGGFDTLVMENITILPGQWNELDVVISETVFEVGSSPEDGETDVSVSSTIIIDFTRPIDKRSVDGESIVILRNSTGEVIDTVFSFVDSEPTLVYVTPELLMDFSAIYMVHITTGIVDIYGKHLPHNRTFRFITEMEVLDMGPQEFFPDEGSTDVPVDVRISVKFPFGINVTTLNTDTFQFFKAGGSGVQVSGNISYDRENLTAVFVPDGELYFLTRYSVVLTPDIRFTDITYAFTGATWYFDTEMPLPEAGFVTGYLLERNGGPPDMSTYVELVSGDSKYSIYVDDNGYFLFSEIEPGMWTLNVLQEGRTVYSSSIYVEAGRTTDLGDVIVFGGVQDGQDEESSDFILISVIITVILMVLVYIIVRVNMKKSEKQKEVERKDEPKLRVPSPPVKKVRAPIVHEIRSAGEDDEEEDDDHIEDAIVDEMINKRISEQEGDEGPPARPRELGPPPGM